MLPARSRMRRSADFTLTVRRGPTTVRAGQRAVVVHLAVPSPGVAPRPPRVGFVVPRGVGPAVVRNTVRRRLRHLVADRLPGLPAGCLLVVRALPAAAGSSSTTLGTELDRALAAARRRLPGEDPEPTPAAPGTASRPTAREAAP